MRIFSPQMGLNPDSSSGGEVYDVEILTRLAKRGHQVDVLLRRSQKAPKTKNLNIHYLPISINTVTYNMCFMPWVFQVPKIKKLIKKADIFRVHSPYFMGLGAAFFKKSVKKTPPIWFHYHHMEKFYKMKGFDKFIPKYADGITVDTESTMRDLEKICPDVKGKPYSVINVGTDTDLFKPHKPNMELRESLKIKKDDLVVLYIGHLIHRKGIDVLMESWKNVRKKFKNVHLILIGRGPLKYLVKEHQEDDKNIHIVPYVSTKEGLVEYYNISDIFAFPTRLEGHGMVAAEAMSCGLPVVTTNAKGVNKIVLNKNTGYMVNIDDVKQFTEKLKTLLSDGSLRERMGIAGRKLIEEKWSWNTSIDQVERFMERVVNRN